MCYNLISTWEKHYMSRATHEFIRTALEHIPSAAGLPLNTDV